MGLAKKEKEDAKRERERLRAELAKDKAERQANKGYRKSQLGVEGYNPTGMSASMAKEMEDEDRAAEASSSPGNGTSSSGAAAKASAEEQQVPAELAETAVDKALASLMRYQVGGDGGKALKLLCAVTKNLVESPNEEKYRSLKADGAAVKTKLAPLTGGLGYLKAIGFVKNDDTNAWELSLERRDLTFLGLAREKVEAAFAKYSNK